MAESKDRDPDVPITLRDLLGAGELTDTRAMELGRSLAEALVQAHRQGRFSAQLTDRKVLVLGGDRVSVAGLDGRAEQGRPAPLHTAPEQWRDVQPGGAAQVWALGLLLHQMIAGRHPYADVSGEDLHEVVTGDEPVPLDDCFQEVAPRLAELVAGCLHKDPEQRPSAQRVSDVLGDLLDSCSPSDPGAREREQKRTRRRLEQLEQRQAKPRRTALGLLVGAMVVLILSAIHYRYLWQDKKEQGEEPGKQQQDSAAPAPGPATKVWNPEDVRGDTGSRIRAGDMEPAARRPDARAPVQPRPAATTPTAPPTNELYPTSTPEPATKPLPVPLKPR